MVAGEWSRMNQISVVIDHDVLSNGSQPAPGAALMVNQAGSCNAPNANPHPPDFVPLHYYGTDARDMISYIVSPSLLPSLNAIQAIHGHRSNSSRCSASLYG
jgi:hypothetical protein